MVKKKTGGAYLYAYGNNLTTLLSVYTVYTQSVLRIPPPAPRPDDGRAALHGECDASCLLSRERYTCVTTHIVETDARFVDSQRVEIVESCVL